MMNLIAAAALAAQPAPAANPPMQQMPMEQMQQKPMHEGMKDDCCAECCKDMAAKHDGHADHVRGLAADDH